MAVTFSGHSAARSVHSFVRSFIHILTYSHLTSWLNWLRSQRMCLEQKFHCHQKQKIRQMSWDPMDVYLLSISSWWWRNRDLHRERDLPEARAPGDFATSTSGCSLEADEVPFSPMCSAEAKVKNAMTWIRSMVMAAPCSANRKFPSIALVSLRYFPWAWLGMNSEESLTNYSNSNSWDPMKSLRYIANMYWVPPMGQTLFLGTREYSNGNKGRVQPCPG